MKNVKFVVEDGKHHIVDKDHLDVNTVFTPTFDNYREVLAYLKSNNYIFQKSQTHNADISENIMLMSHRYTQAPYAVIVTCSDSRVTPEYVFCAGIGELFVIRNAGNVVGEFELGSIEYAVSVLKSKLVVILGHELCGAVTVSYEGEAEGFMKSITNEICPCIKGATSLHEAVEMNVKNSVSKCLNSPIIKRLVDRDDIAVVGGVYNLKNGKVVFLD